MYMFKLLCVCCLVKIHLAAVCCIMCNKTVTILPVLFYSVHITGSESQFHIKAPYAPGIGLSMTRSKISEWA